MIQGMKAQGNWWRLWTALLLIPWMLLTAGMAEGETTPRRMTVMIYMCGSNLESEYGSATVDLNEMTSARTDSDEIAVLAMVGGSKAWMAGYNPDETGILEIIKGRRRVIRGTEADRNMGDSASLAEFLQFGVENYPAEEYALILWDHGAGPVNGICWDERFGGDHLTLEELTSALESSPFKGRKLSWVGFDACLMSSVEVASRLSPYAEYMIASQAEEPAKGWNYSFLNGLERDAGPEETARRIIDAYFETEYQTEVDLTLACVDLSRVAEVESCMDRMYLQISRNLNPQTFSSFSRMRFSATRFGKGAGTSGYDLVDLVALSDSYLEIDLAGAEQIRDAVEAAVVVNHANVENSCGLSVYHPYRNQEQYLRQWQRAYQDLNFCPGYTRYVDAYGQIMTGKELVLWNGLSRVQAIAAGNMEGSYAAQGEENAEYMITLDLSPEQASNLSSARLLILARNLYDAMDDAWFRVYSSSAILDGTQLTAYYDGKALQAVDEYGYTPLTGAISYEITEDGLLLVNLYPRQADAGLPEHPIIAEYMESGDGTPLRLKDYVVYDSMTESYTRRAEIDWSRYSGITFLNTYRNRPAEQEDGYPSFESWTEDPHTFVQWSASQEIDITQFQLTFALDLARGEELFAAFEITDTQGNVHTSEVVPLSDRQVMREHYDEADFSMDREATDIKASLRTDWVGHQAEVALEVTNISWADPNYYFEPLSLNGIDISPQVFWKTEEETGALEEAGVNLYDDPATVRFFFSLGQEALPMLHPDGMSDVLKARLRIQNRWGEQAIIPVSMILDFPASYLSHTQEDPPLPDQDYLLSTTIPDVDFDLSKLSADLVIRQGEEAADATIILNVSLFNAGEGDLEIDMAHLRVSFWSAFNGYPVDDERLQSMNIITSSAMDRVAPGETAIASFTFQYDPGLILLDGLPPDVSLQEMSFSLAIYQYEEGRLSGLVILPVILETDTPLGALYPDTEALPSQELTSQLFWNDSAFNADQAVPLFSTEECSVSLQSIFVQDNSPVLLLRVKNDSDEVWHISLAEATVNGENAEIGQRVNKFARYMNNRLSVFQMEDQLWQAPKSAGVTVDPQSERFHFVSLTPTDGSFGSIHNIAMCAMIYSDSTNLESDVAYYGPAEIRLQHTLMLPSEKEVRVSAQECDIIPGKPVRTEAAGGMIRDKELSATDVFSVSPVLLHLDAPEGAEIASVQYALLRRVRSSAEAASHGIWMFSQHSFTAHPEWLLYEAMGDLRVSEDGSFAEGEFPGLLPGIQTSGGMMTLPISQIEEDGAGRIQFVQIVSGNSLDTTKYYFSKTGPGLEGPVITMDRGSGRISLELPSAWQSTSYYPSLVDMLTLAWVPIIPADVSSSVEIEEALFGEESLYEILLHEIPGHQLQFSLIPITNPEDYAIMYFVRLTNGDSYYTLPRPLADD